MNGNENRAKIFGLLIHKLPLEYKREALESFPREFIKNTLFDRAGLQICFTNYDCVRSSICGQNVEVRGTSYKIYPLVTNLTICGVGNLEISFEIERWAANYGTVIDLYRISDVTQHRNSKTTFLMDDFRVILDVPEVLANFDLLPLRLKNHTFPVKFFCRLCRQNGHKQYQCPKYFPSATYGYHDGSFAGHSKSQESGSTSNKMNAGYVTKIKTDPDDFSINNNHSPKKEIHGRFSNEYSRRSCESESHNRLEEDYGLNAQQTDLYNSGDTHPFREVQDRKSNWKQMEAKCADNIKCSDTSDCNDLNFSDKHFNDGNFQKDDSNIQSQYRVNEMSSNNNRRHGSMDKWQQYPKSSGVYNKNKQNFKKNRIYGNESSDGHHSDYIEDKIKKSPGNRHIKTQSSTSSLDKCTTRTMAEPTCSNAKKLKKKSSVDFSLIFPQTITNFKYKEKLLNHVLDTNPSDISPEIEKILSNILAWNSLQKVKNKHREEEKRFLQLLKLYVSKAKSRMKKQQCQAKMTGKNTTKRKTQHMQDGGLKYPTLSEGIKEAVSKTTGVLSPGLLCNFLNQVRGRKNLSAVTVHFTEDISSLSAQLLEVEQVYFQEVQKRGKEENNDISFMRRLRERLLKDPKNSPCKKESYPLSIPESYRMTPSSSSTTSTTTTTMPFGNFYSDVQMNPSSKLNTEINDSDESQQPSFLFNVKTEMVVDD